MLLGAHECGFVLAKCRRQGRSLVALLVVLGDDSSQHGVCGLCPAAGSARCAVLASPGEARGSSACRCPCGPPRSSATTRDGPEPARQRWRASADVAENEARQVCCMIQAREPRFGIVSASSPRKSRQQTSQPRYAGAVTRRPSGAQRCWHTLDLCLRLLRARAANNSQYPLRNSSLKAASTFLL